MNTRDIEAFVAVVETGSIVAASARLHLTQPGVTRRVQSLEETLGVPLLDRLSKPLKPTAAGREAYELGRRVLRSVEDLKDGTALDGALTGEFRIGLTPFLAEIMLAAPLDRLRTQYPHLTLRISSAWTPILAAEVLSSRLDAAALFLPEGMDPSADLDCVRLGSTPLLVVAPLDMDLPAQPVLRDLAEKPWIMNEEGCGFRLALRRALEGRRLPLNIVIEALAPELRLSLVARGLGLSLTTPSILAVSPLKDQVRVVEVSDFEMRLHLWLVHRPPAGRLAAPIETLRAALVEALESPAACATAG
jgi:DNA-binding transcriptional LysR family regulator